MTAAIQEQDESGNPKRFVFTDVKEVVLVRDDTHQWTLWVGDVELCISGKLMTYEVDAKIVGMSEMRSVEEETEAK